MSGTCALVLLLAGCATTPPEPSLSAAQRAQLLKGDSILEGRPLPEIEKRDILAVDADMQAFIERHVDPAARLSIRLDQLLSAVVEDESFGLHYEGHTRTAAETFHHRNGNCLAFTNMFIAMARALELEASFQEVDIPPVWDRQGDTIILNRHVNVNVQNIDGGSRSSMLSLRGRRSEYDRVIDFNVSDFRTFFTTRLISDERAFAHFYSNLGAEAVRDHKHAIALAYFRRALEYEPTFAAAWTNLGVLYSRVEDLESAKRAYQQSLFHDPENVTTTSNLASVLQRLGDNVRAESLLADVEHYRNRSPYFRYYLATAAVGEGDYETALEHLQYAVRKQPKEERFQFALSVVYTALGSYSEAEQALSAAKNLAASPSSRQRYDLKLRQLRISFKERALSDT